MKYFVLFILVLTTLVACDQAKTPQTQRFPWQITVLTNGHSQVFGIELGRTRLQEVAERFGRRQDVGLFENQDKSLSLEAYFSEVTIAGLSGKFILSFDLSETELKAIRDRAGNAKRQKSGGMRYTLSKADRQQLMSRAVSGLSYIPYVNLDMEMIEKRFGSTLKVIEAGDGRRHYLYPQRGLALFYDEEGRELLQYVNPADFHKLEKMLRQKPAA